MKGQATLFIILAILVVAALIAYPLVQQVQYGGNINDQITTFTEECMLQTAENGLELVGLQGGYAFPIDELGYVNFGSVNTMFGYVEGADVFPSNENIEDQLAVYMDEFVNVCLQDYRTIDEFTVADIERGTSSTQVQITEREVIFTLDMPVKTVYDDETFEVEEFRISISMPFNDILDTARTSIQMLKESPGMLDLTAMYDYPYNAQYMPIDNRYGVMSFVADKEIKGRPYTFMFGVDHGDNQPPLIHTIPTLRVKLGEEVSFYVEATDLQGDDFFFSDNEVEFDIDPTSGLVRFTPTQKGTFTYYVQAIDLKGLISEKSFTVVIV